MAHADPVSASDRRELGALGEQIAVEHLRGLGLQILARNWRCRYGELDVIAAEGGAVVVFVEVKTRSGDRFGGPEQAVTPPKLRRLRRLAGIWLAGQEHRWPQIRLDVIGVRLGRLPGPQITHLRGVG